MKKITLLALIATNALCATEGKEEPVVSIEIGKISEAFGHLIGKNIENIGLQFDMAQVIKGLQDESSGKASPMTEVECVQAIASIQERIFKEQSSENLKKAEGFLAEHIKRKEIVSLQEGRVLYEVNAPGEGAIVESHFSPLIRYTGKYLDGSVFSASKEDELISLDEVIPGLKAGLVGMKEGEKRTVFIHPDLAYGTSGYLHPNSLLTFEVEIIKANAAKPEAAETGSKPSTEIAESKTEVR